MDKLVKYNQKLLAIIGTTVIVALVLLIIVGVGGLVISFLDFSNDDGAGLKIKNSDQGTDTKVVRTQQITFNNPVQLDTAETNFLIPVGQVNLESEEVIGFEKGSGFSYSESGFGRFKSYHGLFNNFILFEYESGVRTRLFSEKVVLTNWSNVKMHDKALLLFLGTSDDTNEDDRLDANDYQTLYAFYLEDKKLVAYKIDGKTVLGYEPMKKTALVAIRVGIDKNKDFDFDKRTEPQEIVVLNVNSRALEAMVPREMKAEIQQTID